MNEDNERSRKDFGGKLILSECDSNKNILFGEMNRGKETRSNCTKSDWDFWSQENDCKFV